jgi:hypothetical protein
MTDAPPPIETMVGCKAMRRLVRALACIGVAAACGGASGPPAPAPAAPACGVVVYDSPICQGVLERSCCTELSRCAADASCAQFYDCTRQNRGQPDDIVNRRCLPLVHPESPNNPTMAAFSAIASCGQRVADRPLDCK